MNSLSPPKTNDARIFLGTISQNNLSMFIPRRTSTEGSWRGRDAGDGWRIQSSQGGPDWIISDEWRSNTNTAVSVESRHTIVSARQNTEIDLPLCRGGDPPCSLSHHGWRKCRVVFVFWRILQPSFTSGFQHLACNLSRYFWYSFDEHFYGVDFNYLPQEQIICKIKQPQRNSFGRPEINWPGWWIKPITT